MHLVHFLVLGLNLGRRGGLGSAYPWFKAAKAALFSARLATLHLQNSFHFECTFADTDTSYIDPEVYGLNII